MATTWERGGERAAESLGHGLLVDEQHQVAQVIVVRQHHHRHVLIGLIGHQVAETRPAAVLRPSELPTHERGGGARTTPLVGPSCGATSFINGITSFAPGAAIAFHSHNCEESVMLLEGEAMLDIEGQPSVRLQALDPTWLPPNLSHRFRNLSDTQPM